METGKVNAKKRKVFEDDKGRTYVKQGDKKVYVKKLFTPKADTSVAAKSPIADTGKVNAKKRKVFKNSKERTYVKQGDRKVYVKKLFTPKPISPVIVAAKSPIADTGKVNAKKRKVFKNSKERTYVKQGDKKVYVKKLFTPKADTTAVRVSGPFDKIQRFGCLKRGIQQSSSTCWFNSALNGLVLSSSTSNMILADMKKLDVKEQKSIVASAYKQRDACPLALSKKYVYSYAYMLHSDKYKVGSRNDGVSLIGGLFTPGRLNTPTKMGRQGYKPLEAIEQLLRKLFGENSYAVVDDFTNDIDGKGKKFVIHTGISTLWMSELNIGKYELSHVVYAMRLGPPINGYHVAVAYACDGDLYVYDSNKENALKIDWTNRKNRDAIMSYSSTPAIKVESLYGIRYGLYVKK
ncbi:PBCV-specific basic adaptor domain-containing protein [Paramecium bursaria Chlorella virus NE-JV-1]|nr:PBCV-specific basic adaptor domain-containing protein [Paramecium bursaria Chlorella virus NE-JV-1]